MMNFWDDMDDGIKMRFQRDGKTFCEVTMDVEKDTFTMNMEGDCDKVKKMMGRI